jgi:hypothetical protein
MPTKRKNASKRRSMTRKNSRSPNNTITKTSDNIFAKLKDSGIACLDGCKGFGAYFFTEYLSKLRKIKRNEFDTYVNELLYLESNMNHNITNHVYQMNRLQLPVHFLSEMSSIEFDDITKGNLVYCSSHKKLDSMIMQIHTFILSNGTTIYNSWTSDTTIDCSEMGLYNKEYVYYDDDEETECAKKVAIMSPTKVYVSDAFGSLKKLVSNNTDFELITSLFGLKKSNIIGTGKGNNSSAHRDLIENDQQKILRHFNDSDILFVRL